MKKYNYSEILAIRTGCKYRISYNNKGGILEESLFRVWEIPYMQLLNCTNLEFKTDSKWIISAINVLLNNNEVLMNITYVHKKGYVVEFCHPEDVEQCAGAIDKNLTTAMFDGISRYIKYIEKFIPVI